MLSIGWSRSSPALLQKADSNKQDGFRMARLQVAESDDGILGLRRVSKYEILSSEFGLMAYKTFLLFTLLLLAGIERLKLA